MDLEQNTTQMNNRQNQITNPPLPEIRKKIAEDKIIFNILVNYCYFSIG